MRVTEFVACSQHFRNSRCRLCAVRAALSQIPRTKLATQAAMRYQVRCGWQDRHPICNRLNHDNASGCIMSGLVAYASEKTRPVALNAPKGSPGICPIACRYPRIPGLTAVANFMTDGTDESRRPEEHLTISSLFLPSVSIIAFQIRRSEQRVWPLVHPGTECTELVLCITKIISTI